MYGFLLSICKILNARATVQNSGSFHNFFVSYNINVTLSTDLPSDKISSYRSKITEIIFIFNTTESPCNLPTP